jgi:hypothetical protein
MSTVLFRGPRPQKHLSAESLEERRKMLKSPQNLSGRASTIRAVADGIYALAADRGAGGAREEVQLGGVRPPPKERSGLPLRLAPSTLLLAVPRAPWLPLSPVDSFYYWK